MAFWKLKPETNRKVTIYSELPFALRIIDAAISHWLTKLGYVVCEGDEDLSGFDIVESAAMVGDEPKIIAWVVRKQTTLASVVYRWMGDPRDVFSATFGGVTLREKRNGLTEIILFSPSHSSLEPDEIYKQRMSVCLTRAGELVKKLEQDGYLPCQSSANLPTSGAGDLGGLQGAMTTLESKKTCSTTDSMNMTPDFLNETTEWQRQFESKITELETRMAYEKSGAVFAAMGDVLKQSQSFLWTKDPQIGKALSFTASALRGMVKSLLVDISSPHLEERAKLMELLEKVEDFEAMVAEYNAKTQPMSTSSAADGEQAEQSSNIVNIFGAGANLQGAQITIGDVAGGNISRVAIEHKDSDKTEDKALEAMSRQGVPLLNEQGKSSKN